LDFVSILSVLGAAIELAALNLLLCADNAVAIALACRPLPFQLRKQALLIGVAGAIVVRFGLMIVVNALLAAPGLRLAAAVFLVWIAAKLLNAQWSKSDKALADTEAASRARISVGLYQSVLLVIAVDCLMSFDNIVALVAVSQGNAGLLLLGLILSIPALTYGSLVLTRMFDEWPALILAGAILLGWIAGQMAASDRLLSAWISRQAPALVVVLPALCACYMYAIGHPSVRRADRS
jgi:YjbE family integral membrane protein